MSEDPAECFGKRFKWDKVSNSGDILKLLVPSHSRAPVLVRLHCGDCEGALAWRLEVDSGHLDVSLRDSWS